MARGFVRKNNLTKDTIIKILAMGVLVGVASTSPYFLHTVVKKYFKDKSKKAIRARAKKLRELERKKLVSFKMLGGGKVKMVLTHRGKLLIREYDIDNIKLQRPEKWDEMWRVIIYDIPVAQRKASNAFRQKIRAMGLFQLQRSVWVSPYECLSEIEFIATVFDINIDRCICYFKTKNIPKEKEIKKHFDF